MTKTEILAQCERVTGRTDLTTSFEFYYAIAHKFIQRANNKFTETKFTSGTSLAADDSVNSILLTTAANIDSVEEFKEPISLYVQNVDTGYMLYKYEIIQFIEEFNDIKANASFQNPAQALNDTNLRHFCHFSRVSILVFPDFGTDLLGSDENQLVLAHHRWLSPDSDEDFFTRHAFDFLLYKTLFECVPQLGLSDSLEKKWEDRMNKALGSFVAMDISRRHAGPLKMRV